MEIPLFPLPNLVLFPNLVVPLHIFEDRYQLMINGCIDRSEAFGLVLLRAGAAEESEETIHTTGVSVRIVEVERLDGGRMNILCEGESRFRIHQFTQRTPFWKANVTHFDEETLHAAQSLYQQAADMYRKLSELGARLSGSPQTELLLPESPTELSYTIAYVLDIDSEDKQSLLEMTSTSERLRALITHLSSSIKKIEQQIGYKDIVKKVRGNGDLGTPSKPKEG